MSIVSDYHGKDTRSRAMGIHQTSVYMGTIAGGFFAGLIGQYYGWRWSFVVFGGLGIVLGFVLQKFLIEPQRGAADLAPLHTAAPSFLEFLRTVASTPTLLLLMGAFLCANFVAVVLLSWMPKFLYDKFHMGLAAAGLTATLFVQLASMAGSPLGGWLADRLRQRSPRGRMSGPVYGSRLRGSVRSVVRAYAIGWLGNLRADCLGLFQRTVRRKYLGVCTGRGSSGSPRRDGWLHERDWLGRRRLRTASDRHDRAAAQSELRHSFDFGSVPGCGRAVAGRNFLFRG